MTPKLSIRVALVTVIVLLVPIFALQPGPTAGTSGTLRTFFAFEKEIWLETPGAELRLNRPVRHSGEPVIPRGEPGSLDSHRVELSTILPQGKRLRAWYGAMGPPSKGQSFDLHQDLAVAYAESHDGIHWEKPDLNLVPGGKNLLIKGGFYMTVHPDPEQGYRAAVAFFRPDVGTPGAEPGATFGIATSRDGLNWNFDRQSAISARHFESYGMFFRDGAWWVLGQGVPPYFPLAPGASKRVMHGFYSQDGRRFEHFPRPLFQYEGSPYFPDGSMQTHVGAGVWDRGRILIGFSGHFWPGGFSTMASYSIGLTYSYDGTRWTEPFYATPLFLPAERGRWDGGWVFQVQRPVSRDGQTYFYYVGADRGNEWEARSALGLATLRRDGFACWTAPQAEAALITQPLRLEDLETHLYLNAKGPLTVQLLDTYLRPLSPPVELTGDEVRASVMRLDSLRLPARFRLAFTLSPRAELYSFSFGPAERNLAPLSDWE